MGITLSHESCANLLHSNRKRINCVQYKLYLGFEYQQDWRSQEREKCTHIVHATNYLL